MEAQIGTLDEQLAHYAIEHARRFCLTDHPEQRIIAMTHEELRLEAMRLAISLTLTPGAAGDPIKIAGEIYDFIVCRGANATGAEAVSDA